MTEEKGCYGKRSLWEWHSARASVYNHVQDWEYGHLDKDLMLMIIETTLMAGIRTPVHFKRKRK